MGWMYTSRPAGRTNLEFFQEQFTGADIIECATIRGVFYAACRSRALPDTVFAMICLTRWAPLNSYNFGFKDMDESMGPSACDCPARVLDALTPATNEYAQEWRSRCRAMLARPTVKVGQTIELSYAMTFGGIPETRLTKVSYMSRRNIFRGASGRLVRFTNYRDYAYKVVGQ